MSDLMGKLIEFEKLFLPNELIFTFCIKWESQQTIGRVCFGPQFEASSYNKLLALIQGLQCIFLI